MQKSIQALWAFAPLLLFYIVEDHYGLKAGLILAMALALLELAWHWLRHRRLEKMVLFSSGLILFLGGLSLLSDDERFMLYTPVIGDLMVSGILALSLLRGRPLLLSLAGQQDPEILSDPIRRAYMGSLTGRLAINLALHAAVTAWSTGESREIWIFVSGPLQYLFLGFQLVGEFLYARLIILPRLEAEEAKQALETIGGLDGPDDAGDDHPDTEADAP